MSVRMYGRMFVVKKVNLFVPADSFMAEVSRGRGTYGGFGGVGDFGDAGRKVSLKTHGTQKRLSSRVRVG